MSERAAMKRRVRGLLHRKWLAPLGALALAALPPVVSLAAVLLLIPSLGSGFAALGSQIAELPAKMPGFQLAASVLFPDAQQPLLDVSVLGQTVPGLVVLLAVCLFVAAPVAVSVSGYFLSLLRGKGPTVSAAFDCFSGKYLRYLGGMLYRALWVCVWAAAALFGTYAVYNGGRWLIAALAEWLSSFQFTAVGVMIALTLIWFVVFTMLLVNRVLAYAFTPVCIAAQPRLPARRAVRLSRKLMRGCKWRLIGLYASFLPYFLPAILAGVGLLAMPRVLELLALSDILAKAARVFLILLAVANLPLAAYVAPYLAASFRAFYIERKREALMDEEVTPSDFASGKENHAE